VVAPAAGIIVKLAVEIARVQSGEARGHASIAFAIEAMTRYTGIGRPAVAPAESDHLATGEECGIATGGHLTAAESDRHEQGHQMTHCFTEQMPGPSVPNGEGRSMGARIALMAALMLGACNVTQVEPYEADAHAIARGKAAAQRVGCGACHAIPGLWPQGTTGPSLTDFARRGMIAGKLPNRPDALAAFLLDPSGTAMPRQPLTPAEAADIAAYLHSADAG
jgi:mono/diheme cytochrome c family protein